MTTAIKPISPDEAAEYNQHALPDEVIACWNKLIAKNFDGTEAFIRQDDAVKALLDAMGLDSTYRHLVFERDWLEIEPLYRAAGWKVEYDKPSYYEIGDPSFTFSR